MDWTRFSNPSANPKPRGSSDTAYRNRRFWVGTNERGRAFIYTQLGSFRTQEAAERAAENGFPGHVNVVFEQWEAWRNGVNFGLSAYEPVATVTARGGVGVVRENPTRSTTLLTDRDVLDAVRQAKKNLKSAETRAWNRYHDARMKAYDFYGSTDVEQAARNNVTQRARVEQETVAEAAREAYHRRIEEIRSQAGQWADLVPG